MYDAIVIGKGMLGSTTARTLATAGARVAIVGPDEPANPGTHDGVFAAHYDQARAMWRLGRNVIEEELATRHLETLTSMVIPGLTTPVGVIRAVAERYRRTLETEATRASATVDHHILGAADLQERWPQLSLPMDTKAAYEHPPAGHFNPRLFVQAAVADAVKHGARVFPTTATAISHQNRQVEVALHDGGPLSARTVIVANGAWAAGSPLLQRPLALRTKHETVLYAELDGDELHRLADLPVLIYQNTPGDTSEIYMLPPVQYPDGRWHIKIGANTRWDRYAVGAAAVNAWYRHGASNEALPALRRDLLQLIPDLRSVGWATHRCVVTYTAHGWPYIDELIPGRVFSAVGGNGRSAKWSDPLGVFAASLVLDEPWPSDIPPETFRAVYADEQPTFTRGVLFQDFTGDSDI